MPLTAATWHGVNIHKLRLAAMWRHGRAEAGGAAAGMAVRPARTDVITCLQLARLELALTGSGNKTMRRWSTLPSALAPGPGQMPSDTLAGHAGGVWCCTIEGDTLVSGSTDHEL